MQDVTVTLWNTTAGAGRVSSSFLSDGGQWVGGGMPVDAVVGANSDPYLQGTLRLNQTCQLNLQITFGDGSAGSPFRTVSADLTADRVPIVELPENIAAPDYDPDLDGEGQETGEWWDVKVNGDQSMAAVGLPVTAGYDEDDKSASFQIGP